MTVSIKASEIEPVKTLLAEVATVYPALVEMRSLPEVDQFCKAIEAFRDKIGKKENESEVSQVRIGDMDRQHESVRKYQECSDTPMLLRVDLTA